jgi:hypothetical protein
MQSAASYNFVYRGVFICISDLRLMVDTIIRFLYLLIIIPPAFVNLCCNIKSNNMQFTLQFTKLNVHVATNSVKQKTLQESNNGSGGQEIPHHLRNLKDLYHVPKSPPLVPNLSQINPVHTFPPYILFDSYFHVILQSKSTSSQILWLKQVY